MTGMATSDSPQRIHNAQPHRAKPRKKSARDADQHSQNHAGPQCRGGQQQRRKQTIQIGAHYRYGKDREAESKQSANYSNHERFRQHEEEYEAVCESDGFEHRQFAGAFADGNRHGVSRDEEQGEEHHAANGRNQRLNIAELLGEAGLERGFSFRLRFIRGVRKAIIDGLAHANRVVRGVQFQDPPAGLALNLLRNIFIEIIPLEPELAFVAAFLVIGVNPVKVEFPGFGRTVKRVLQRNAVTHLPLEALGEIPPSNRTLTIVNEIFPLIVGNTHLGHDLALVLRIDHKLREEILFVLIDPAEPIVVGSELDALDLADLIAVRKGHGIDKTDEVDDHEPIRARQFRTAAEGAFYYREKSKQEESYRKGANRQCQANLLAKKIGEYQAAVFHAAPPARTGWADLPASMRTPLSR